MVLNKLATALVYRQHYKSPLTDMV